MRPMPAMNAYGRNGSTKPSSNREKLPVADCDLTRRLVFMNRVVFAASMSLVLASCSSSGDGGSSSDAATTSAATSGSSGGQEPGAGGAGGAGGGAPSLGQNYPSNMAWARFQGEFDSAGDGDDIPPTARRLVGCPVNAPELGDRVVYLERSRIDGEGDADRQFLVALQAAEQVGPSDNRAVGVIVQPADPAAWAGRCDGQTELELLSDVVDGGECLMNLTMNEIGGLSVSAPPMPAACLSAASQADQVSSIIVLGNDEIEWQDALTDVEGVTSYDPASEGSGYRLARRTPMPPVPESP